MAKYYTWFYADGAEVHEYGGYALSRRGVLIHELGLRVVHAMDDENDALTR